MARSLRGKKAQITGVRRSAERIASTVRSHAKSIGRSLDSLAELLDVSRSTVFQLAGAKPTPQRASRATTTPHIDTLRRLGELTGRSVDWLLGFDDVRPNRIDRARIGVLSEEVRAELKRNAPRDAPATEFPSDAAILVNQVSAAWWSVTLRQTAAAAGRRLDLLADRLNLDAVRSFTHVAPLLSHRADQFRRYANVLRSPAVRWKELEGFETPSSLMADNAMRSELGKVGIRADGAMLWTPFNVWAGAAGVGVAWRAAGEDALWYVDADTRDVEHRRGEGILVSPDGWEGHGSFTGYGIKET